jgi:hypothetical protein
VLTHASRLHLLQGLVDYAGLFPPAGLPLADTLRNYAHYQQGPAAFLLGRLVCPASKLDQVDATDGLRISALLNHVDELACIDAFHARMPARVRVDCIETRFLDAAQTAELSRRWQYFLYYEVAAEQLEQACQVCGPAPRVGLKFRTGSVQAEGIPPAPLLTEYVRAAREAGLPFKFTAGLHHALSGEYPLTYELDSPRARMYGFVTLFGLACLFWWRRIDEQRFVEGLSQDGEVIRLDHNGLSAGEAHCTPSEIEEFRSRGGRSFGSCSFDEPHQELKELGWIA